MKSNSMVKESITFESTKELEEFIFNEIHCKGFGEGESYEIGPGLEVTKMTGVESQDEDFRPNPIYKAMKGNV